MRKFKKPALFALCMMLPVLVGTCLSFAYQYQTMPDLFASLEAQGFGLPVIFLSGLIQTLIFLFIACFFGRILSQKLGLWKQLPFQKKPLLLTLVLSLVGGGILILDCLTFGSVYPAILHNYQAGQNILGLLTGILYGGIVEELLMRLLFMSLLSFLLWKIFARKRTEAPLWTLITGNILAALLFAAGHLPATVSLFGELNALLLIRCLLLNGIGGIFFGFLYRKYGLLYSMLCHMGFHAFFKLFFALFF